MMMMLNDGRKSRGVWRPDEDVNLHQQTRNLRSIHTRTSRTSQENTQFLLCPRRPETCGDTRRSFRNLQNLQVRGFCCPLQQRPGSGRANQRGAPQSRGAAGERLVLLEGLRGGPESRTEPERGRPGSTIQGGTANTEAHWTIPVRQTAETPRMPCSLQRTQPGPTRTRTISELHLYLPSSLCEEEEEEEEEEEDEKSRRAVQRLIMRATAVLLTLFSGLCFLPACFPFRYILVEKALTWSEAQTYCREKYMDLAPVHTEEDLANLITLTDESPDVWIGLQADSDSWRWSLEDPDYYGPGEADFRAWHSSQPNDQNDRRACVRLHPYGWWDDDYCSKTYSSICYNKDADESTIFVDTGMSWDEARSYCRKHHTDLASVRNLAENQRMKGPSSAWIGLYRDGWKWSDGDAVSFTNWAPNAPNNNRLLSCGASRSGQWVNDDCSSKKPFVCSVAFTETRRVKVVVSRSDSSVDMEELQAGILEELNRRVATLGLSGSVKLRWTKQPDGKIFHKQEEEEEKEEDGQSCPHK